MQGDKNLLSHYKIISIFFIKHILSFYKKYIFVNKYLYFIFLQKHFIFLQKHANE